MIEHALRRVYGQVAPDIARSSRRRLRIDLALLAGSLVVAFGLMPLIYAALLVDVSFARAVAGASGAHILLNCAANAAVMLLAIRLNGRFDRKLAGVLTRVLVVHGGMAFIILVARLPHSNQVMLMAAAGSALLGAAVIFIKHRVLDLRVALFGPWHPLIEETQISCDWINDPNGDLSSYDLLLAGSVVDLSPEWAKALSKAMLMGKSVRLVAEFMEEDRGLVSLEHFDLEHLPAAGLTSYRTRKRLMDLALVIMALPVALPLLALGALLVWMTMGRPVLFVQSRVGLGGRVFRMYKLRTMRVPTAVGDATATAGRDDARITTVGRWLRRFRIDELPQLWNVLIGDMSIIGPRPEWTLLSERYIHDLPVYAYRHLVRPGITGWAQVRGGYAADLAETRAKVGYDLFYIKNLSFSMDVQILVRTIWTLLSGSGAR